MTLRLKAGNKFGAKRTVVNGISFHSKQEAKRWIELKLLERAGDISGLERQKRFALDVNGVHVTAYVADFVYHDVRAGLQVVEDSKGARTPEYRIKAALMLACHRIIILETGAKRSWKQSTQTPSKRSRAASHADLLTTNS